MFFKKKKKDKKQEKLPPLKFPDIPSEFPKYESNMENEHQKIKEAVIPQKPSLEDLGIPVRKQIPPIRPQTQFQPEQSAREKTLFIKLEQYKKAVKLLDDLKYKIDESQKILNKLKEIKDEEDAEIGSWQANLERIKEDLLEIDTKLFEE